MQLLTCKILCTTRRFIKRLPLLVFVTLFACFFVNVSFTNGPLPHNDPSFMAVISITGSDASTGKLILSDHGNTITSRSQKVKWIIEPNSGVKAITGITVKDGSTNVFDPEPQQLGNSSNWQGKISPTIPVPSEELYNIIWIDENDNEHTYDPKIQVKS